MTLASERVRLGDERFSDVQIASTLSRKTQQLIILPTEKCNFRCTYCYEDFMIGAMKESVQRGIERFLDQRVPELSQLSINWFGGEPLAARKIVLRLSSYAKCLCDKHGVALRGGLTTNAYVLNFPLFEELVSYDQRFFQVTFDGWEEGHNAVRKLAGGGATFDRIWSNLVATRASRQEFEILIRIHVRRDNHRSLDTLLENVARTFGNDRRYSLDFEHLRDLGGDGGKSVDRPLSLAELREIAVDLRARYDVLVSREHGAATRALEPEQTVSASAIGEVKGAAAAGATPYICYAAKPNSLLIRADGRIGKCTVALNDDRNTIGSINEDGSVTIDNALLRPWLRGLSNARMSAGRHVRRGGRGGLGEGGAK